MSVGLLDALGEPSATPIEVALLVLDDALQAVVFLLQIGSPRHAEGGLDRRALLDALNTLKDVLHRRNRWCLEPECACDYLSLPVPLVHLPLQTLSLPVAVVHLPLHPLHLLLKDTHLSAHVVKLRACATILLLQRVVPEYQLFFAAGDPRFGRFGFGGGLGCLPLAAHARETR